MPVYIIDENKYCFGTASSIWICHNDVRLENICFTKELDAVFIDLERCTEVDSLHSLMGASSSCMYQFPENVDY